MKGHMHVLQMLSKTEFEMVTNCPPKMNRCQYQQVHALLLIGRAQAAWAIKRYCGHHQLPPEAILEAQIFEIFLKIL